MTAGRRLLWFSAASGLALTSAAAAALPVAELPLFVSTAATPNVMILFDDSGSMDNVVWGAGYDNSTAYPDWSPRICGGNGDQECWSSDDGNVHLSGLRRSTCPTGYKMGSNGATNKCLRLPDPVGNGDTRYVGNYLNYLFEAYGNGTDLRGGSLIPEITRMTVARGVATSIVESNTNLRIGLASFNPPVSGEGAPGGVIERACGSSTSDLLTTIAGFRSESNTPLAETYYEITRYFRGLTSQFTSGVTYTSPVQYRCQKNFVVVVTDGFPTWDTQFPTDDPADTANASASLPNWDGLGPATTQADYPSFPRHSDGHAPRAPPAQGEGRTLFLDDLAQFGQAIDLRPSGYDAMGESFNDPAFPIQNIVTYAVGFAISNQMLLDAAEYGDGAYYTASNGQQLNQALQTAFADIQRRTSSASAVAANSTRMSSDTFIYQARFSSADWSGQLRAFPLQGNGTLGPMSWDAASLLPDPGRRRILTANAQAAAGARGLEFSWASLTASQQASLNKNRAGVTDGNGAARLAWLRGARDNENPVGLRFRARNSETVLGDIVNSDPVFVGRQDFGFDRIKDSRGDPAPEALAYATFRASAAYQNRRKMVYVGANDGMLHGFDAVTGIEQLAFVPNAAFERLSALTDPAYNENHRYIVDGSARVVDAHLDGAWETVLVGSLGAGGKGVFALRVTDPDSFGIGDVLWEFTDRNDPDLGIAVPQSSIARMSNGAWAAIVANGYDSANDRAVLFIVDLATGAVIKKIDTGAGSASDENGLSTPIPVDVDGDRITDYIYAGDLRGNLWKFDVTAGNANNWGVAFRTGATPKPLFVACSATRCTAANRQPITARPEVGKNPGGGYLVYFGTGRYFAAGDNTVNDDPALEPDHSFYAIQDRNEKGASGAQVAHSGRDTLLQQTVLDTQSLTFGTITENTRVTSENAISSGNQGWFIDLPENGERQVSMPILRGGRVIFTTVTPSPDPCGFGGTSWLMELDAISGARLSYSPFDLNRDALFNQTDFVSLNGVLTPVSARQSKEGIIKTPGIVTAGEVEYKYASGTSGGIDTTVERGSSASGRQSWRHLE